MMDHDSETEHAGCQPSNANSKPDISPSHLINIPPELRLIIYDFLFDYDLENDVENRQSMPPAWFLEPLLTCRLIHEEAYAQAFQRCNFDICVGMTPVLARLRPGSLNHLARRPPDVGLGSHFWEPRISLLRPEKIERVKRIVVHWDVALVKSGFVENLREFFHGVAQGPLRLSRLVFRQKFDMSLMFRYFDIWDVLRYGLWELPPLNVAEVLFPSRWFSCWWLDMDYMELTQFQEGLTELQHERAKESVWRFQVVVIHPDRTFLGLVLRQNEAESKELCEEEAQGIVEL